HIWDPFAFGSYSTKCACAWLTRLDGPFSLNLANDNSDNWSWIWKLRVLENLKHFVWLIMHNSLPTNCFRFHRHITQDPLQVMIPYFGLKIMCLVIMLNNVKRLTIDSPMLLGATSSSHDPRSVSWSPPLDNFFKINVDGSSFGNLGRIGLGMC
ncbi:hypothetical protein D0Y65_034341, partial [Glycine soja]